MLNSPGSTEGATSPLNDEQYMQRAIELASTNPIAPFAVHRRPQQPMVRPSGHAGVRLRKRTRPVSHRYIA